MNFLQLKGVIAMRAIMRLVVYARGGYEEGASGMTFNRSHMALNGQAWAGRWGEYFLRQRYPRTWMIRKAIKSCSKLMGTTKR